MVQVETPLQRMELLLGEEKLAKLKQATVLIVGVGGVGSYAAEALARSGIKRLILVDKDEVALSNLNRQIHATYQSIGINKCEAMKERINTYRNDIEVICKPYFYDESKDEDLLAYPIDFVVDAIDTMSSKLALIKFCRKNKLAFISSMGMANRLDPTKIMITDLSKTSYDPVAKIMRNLVKKEGIKGKIPVVFSSEIPIVQTKVVNENGTTRKEKMPPASSPFVPCAAGLAIASYVTTKIIEN